MEEDFKSIVRIVSEAMGLDKMRVMSKTRFQEFVAARHVSMYIIRELIPEATVQRVGAFFGQDHALVSYAHKKVNQLLDNHDPIYTSAYNKSVRPSIKYMDFERRNMRSIEELCCNMPQLGSPYKYD